MMYICRWTNGLIFSSTKGRVGCKNKSSTPFIHSVNCLHINHHWNDHEVSSDCLFVTITHSTIFYKCWNFQPFYVQCKLLYIFVGIFQCCNTEHTVQILRRPANDCLGLSKILLQSFAQSVHKSMLVLADSNNLLNGLFWKFIKLNLYKMKSVTRKLDNPTFFFSHISAF